MGKYGPEELRIRTLFTQCEASKINRLQLLLSVESTRLYSINYIFNQSEHGGSKDKPKQQP